MIEFKDEIAERAVLSILCNHPLKYLEICDYIEAEDFNSLTHRIIFKSLSDLLQDDPGTLDTPLIRSTAQDLGYKDFDNITSNGEYVDSLFYQKFSVKSLAKHTRRVKDLSVKRTIITTLEDLSNEASKSDKSSFELIVEVERKIQEAISSVDQPDGVSILGQGFFEYANEMADDPREFLGLSTGLKRLDRAIGGGLRKGSVSLMGARPKNFKSGFGLNVARYLAVDQGIPVLILDTELRRDYQRLRLGASVSEVPMDVIENGSWRSNHHYIEAIKGASHKLKEAPLYHIYIGGFPIERSLSTIRYWLTKEVGRKEDGTFNDCLIIYDYIKLMNSKEVKRDLKEYQVLGFQMTALHDFVTRHDVPMLLFCQLNRDGIEKENDSVVASADRLVWFCSNFSILKHKNPEEIEEDGLRAGNMKVKTVLTRYGQGMGDEDYLNLRVRKGCMRMEEGKLKSEIAPPEDIIDKQEADKLPATT